MTWLVIAQGAVRLMMYPALGKMCSNGVEAGMQNTFIRFGVV